jgi:hypothetical protein
MRLNGFARECKAEQVGPRVTGFASLALVVDLGDVAGGSEQKADRQVRILVMSAKMLAEAGDIISGEATAAHDGEVAAEVDEESEQLTASDSKQLATGPPPWVWLAPMRTHDPGIFVSRVMAARASAAISSVTKRASTPTSATVAGSA